MNFAKTFLQLKNFLVTRFSGSTTICRSVGKGPYFKPRWPEVRVQVVKTLCEVYFSHGLFYSMWSQEVDPLHNLACTTEVIINCDLFITVLEDLKGKILDAKRAGHLR